MSQSPAVFIIIPVHNRKATTLACLEQLQQQGALANYQIVVVDDGSIDGTSEAIHSTYPPVVVLPGNGQLWWTGAMQLGMEYAYQQGAEFLIWLNDDTFPSQNTLTLLVNYCASHPQTVVGAQCYAEAELIKPTYGGQTKQGLAVHLFATRPDEVRDCDCISGNLVCFPRSVIAAIGYPPHKTMPHCLADIVYTWEAKKAGYTLQIVGSATAVCAFNPLEEGWASSPIPMSRRWRLLLTPKSNLYPSAYWHYCQSFYGILGVIPFVQVYLRLVLFTIIRWIIPLALIKQLKQLKNRALRSTDVSKSP